MSRAALQTRRGDLMGATRSIQEGLARGVSGPEGGNHPEGDVVDAETRIVPDTLHLEEVRLIEDRQAPSPPADRPSSSADHARPLRPTAGAEERFPGATFARGRASIDYKLYIPPGELSAPRPLLVMLHGCTQNPDDFATGTRMNEVARRQGWLVLYPRQSAAASPQGCWNWFKSGHQRRGRGEPALLAALTQHIVDTHSGNARQVHAAGLSAGGAMAVVLGQTYPELFASVGVHSGLPCGAASNAAEALALMRSGPEARRGEAGSSEVPLRAVPTIVFHGERDMTVHPLNGQQIYRDAFAGLTGIESVEHGREGGRAYTRKTCMNARGQPLAELWLIEGAGHTWSGGDARGSHTDFRGPDAASQMLLFFADHPHLTAR